MDPDPLSLLPAPVGIIPGSGPLRLHRLPVDGMGTGRLEKQQYINKQKYR